MSLLSAPDWGLPMMSKCKPHLDDDVRHQDGDDHDREGDGGAEDDHQIATTLMVPNLIG